MTATNSMTAEVPTSARSTSVPPGVRRIVLLGFMGAGKTTVGRMLAAALGWKFLDLDAHVESRAGASVSELFAQGGEAHFRRLEACALANALGRREVVLALGGGAPEELTSRLQLEQTPGTLVLYLAAPFAVLYDRCMLQSFAAPAHVRPLLSEPQAAEARFHTREKIYTRLARHSVQTAARTPEEVLAAIVQVLS